MYLVDYVGLCTAVACDCGLHFHTVDVVQGQKQVLALQGRESRIHVAVVDDGKRKSSSHIK